MNSVEILFSFVLAITTIFLVIIGIQLIFVLKDLRQLIRKLNKVFDGFEKVAGSLEGGFSEVVGFLAGIKSFFKLIDIFHKKKNEK